MPSLLCSSPTIVDQSFPRDDEQLEIIGIALGEIQAYLERDEALLVKTETLGVFVDLFDWERAGPYPLLKTIYDLLTQWYLQPNESIVDVEKYLSEIELNMCDPHPVPQGTEEEEMVQLWAEDVGKLRYLHDSCCDDKEFFIGIACELAFADEGECKYARFSNDRCFPLVGPDDLSQLADAYEWNTPSDIHQKSVSFRQAKKNCFVLGATEVKNPSSGSHYKVIFEGQRPWALDPNNDPIPPRFLSELIKITGYPLDVIKTALIFGQLPEQALKLERAQR